MLHSTSNVHGHQYHLAHKWSCVIDVETSRGSLPAGGGSGIRMLPKSKPSAACDDTSFAELPSSPQTSRVGFGGHLTMRKGRPTGICGTLPTILCRYGRSSSLLVKGVLISNGTQWVSLSRPP